MQEHPQAAIELFTAWYDELPVHKASGGPPRGTIAAGLVVIDRLIEQYDLKIQGHLAPGGTQIKVSGAAVNRILNRFGETRKFLSEGGRTNRGARSAIERMLQVLNRAKLEDLVPSERTEVLTDLQLFLVNKVKEYHSRQRLSIVYDPATTTKEFVSSLLSAAKENGKEGPVAQYLIGAKLSLRFPDHEVRNESFSTADIQLGEPGDFRVEDTAFHVTTAPMSPVFDKCKSNLDDGLRVYLLVPERVLVGVRQVAENTIPGRIGVESVESFVAQNLDELASFSMKGFRDNLRKLLEKYNERVDSVESDKSMMIDVPSNLLS